VDGDIMASARDLRSLRYRRLGYAASLAIACALSAPAAFALSEIPEEELPLPGETAPGDDIIEREDLPPPADSEQPDQTGEPAPPADASEDAPSVSPPPTGMPVPLPDPVVIPRDPRGEPEEIGNPEGAMPAEPVPEIQYDVSLLPEPVQRMRQLIMEACLTGDLERLRPLVGVGDDLTQLSFGGMDGDPIEFLKSLSGDGEGQEIMAILYEVLAAGFVHMDVGEPSELYVWPYFFAVPLDALTAPQRVELFKLVTAGDYEDMKNFGAYIFYRVGISPEGRWLFFVAGD
jgi:hypothetical protein